MKAALTSFDAYENLAAATVRVHLMKGVRDCAQFFRARGLLDATEGAESE